MIIKHFYQHILSLVGYTCQQSQLQQSSSKRSGTDISSSGKSRVKSCNGKRIQKQDNLPHKLFPHYPRIRGHTIHNLWDTWVKIALILDPQTRNQDIFTFYILLPHKSGPIRISQKINLPELHIHHWDNIVIPKRLFVLLYHLQVKSFLEGIISTKQLKFIVSMSIFHLKYLKFRQVFTYGWI